MISHSEMLMSSRAYVLAAETTAHTLSFALVLLALHPECQQKIYEEVNSVWPPGVPTTQVTTVSFWPCIFMIKLPAETRTEPQRIPRQTGQISTWSKLA